MVLMDSGANEVARPYSDWECGQIESKKPHTRTMAVGLALGSALQAGITMGGELMRAPQNMPILGVAEVTVIGVAR